MQSVSNPGPGYKEKLVAVMRCHDGCAWFDKDKGICAILTIAKALNKTGINVRVAK